MTNGIIFCVCSTSAISVSINSLEAMSKRTQKGSGEERVTAKSKPMMNLVSRCSERNPDVLAITASESLGKTRHESQFPLSSRTEQHHRTGPLEDAYSSSCSEWNTDEKWSSREWKSDEVLEARTVRPVFFSFKEEHTRASITFLSRTQERLFWKKKKITIEQGDLLYSHSTRTDSLLKTIIWILTPKQNQKCR